MEPTGNKAGPPPAPGSKSDAQKNLKSIPMGGTAEKTRLVARRPESLIQAEKRLAQYG